MAEKIFGKGRKRNKKGQSAIEFIMILILVLIFFVLILYFLNQRLLFFEGEKKAKHMSLVLDEVENELMLAKSVGGSYDRIFSVPEELAGMPYNISVVHGRELVIDSLDGSLVRFLPIYVYGDIVPGKNMIVKRGPALGICQNETTCAEETLFNTSGGIQCELANDYWVPCNFKYSYDVIGMRAECGSVASSPARLVITNIDDSKVVYTGESFTVSGELFEFPDAVYSIEDSGNWSVNLTCGFEPSVAFDFYVPYGIFSFYPLIVSSDCLSQDDAYLCQDNMNFSVITRVECVGGECGDAKIWLDP